MPDISVSTVLSTTCFLTFGISEGKKGGTDLHYFIKKSQEKLTIYLRQNEKRLSYPDLFTPLTPPAASPLHWSLKAVCLSEILVALDLDSAITLSNGTIAPFAEVVREFERFFNIKLGDPRNVKRNILDRKIKSTSYLTTLRNRIEKKVE